MPGSKPCHLVPYRLTAKVGMIQYHTVPSPSHLPADIDSLSSGAYVTLTCIEYRIYLLSFIVIVIIVVSE